MKKKVVSTDKAPAAIGPYSQAIRSGDLLITSGQLPIDPNTNELETEIRRATEICMNNLLAILAKEGATAENIIKTTIFLADLNNFAVVNEVYASYFEGEGPARSCVQVAAIPKGAPIEIEAIASLV